MYGWKYIVKYNDRSSMMLKYSVAIYIYVFISREELRSRSSYNVQLYTIYNEYSYYYLCTGLVQ